MRLPRAIVVTKLDDGRTTFDDALAALQSTLGKAVQPSYAPLATGGQITGNISLVSQRVHDYSSGKVEKREATPDEIEVVEQYRSDLIEGIIEESEDADLMDRYLEGDVLKTDELVADLLLAVQHGRFYPVIPVTSVNGLGTEELLRVIEASFPAPGSHALEVTARWSPRSSAPRPTSSPGASRWCASSTAPCRPTTWCTCRGTAPCSPARPTRRTRTTTRTSASAR